MCYERHVQKIKAESDLLSAFHFFLVPIYTVTRFAYLPLIKDTKASTALIKHHVDQIARSL